MPSTVGPSTVGRSRHLELLGAVSKPNAEVYEQLEVYQQLLELERQARPCLLTLPETVIAAKTIQRIDDRSASVPTVRVIGAAGDKRDVPLRLIESIELPV